MDKGLYSQLYVLELHLKLVIIIERNYFNKLNQAIHSRVTYDPGAPTIPSCMAGDTCYSKTNSLVAPITFIDTNQTSNSINQVSYQS